MTETLQTPATCHPDLWKQQCLHCGHVGEIGADIWTDKHGQPTCDHCAKQLNGDTR